MAREAVTSARRQPTERVLAQDNNRPSAPKKAEGDYVTIPYHKMTPETDARVLSHYDELYRGVEIEEKKFSYEMRVPTSEHNRVTDEVFQKSMRQRNLRPEIEGEGIKSHHERKTVHLTNEQLLG